MNYRIEAIDDLDCLRNHATAWDSLAFNAPHQYPTLSYAWISAYLKHRLPVNSYWQVLTAFDDARLVGVLPLVISRERRLMSRQTVISPPADLHTIAADAVVDTSAGTEIYDAIFEYLENGFSDWSELRLPHLPENSPTVAALDARSRLIVCSQPDDHAHIIDATGDYEQYRAGYSRNFRSNLRKAANRLAKLGYHTFSDSSSPDTIQQAVSDFAKVEASSWKGVHGSAVGSSENLKAFYGEVCSNLAAQGRSRFTFLRVADDLAAGLIAFRTNDTVVAWKVGYNEKFARVSPALLLLERLVEVCFNDPDIKEINLVSSGAWHKPLATGSRAYKSIWAYPRRPASLLFGALPRKLYGKIRRPDAP